MVTILGDSGTATGGAGGAVPEITIRGEWQAAKHSIPKHRANCISRNNRRMSEMRCILITIYFRSVLAPGFHFETEGDASYKVVF
ncbi:hypothetical protein GCM10028822_12230 [Hymenobacter terrigena]